jgi:GNAT superfamily N-acetyltransferase
MENDLNSLVRVTKENLKPAALTLSRAFMDYPESVYFIPDEATRQKKQPAIYRMFLRDSITHGEVLATSPKMEGVAIWQLVDGKNPAWRRGFSFGWWWLNLFTDKETNLRREAYFKYIISLRARVTPERYWFLQAIGVDPVYQGQGFSGRLLRPMLARVDSERLPCFLETQLEKNVTLYKHFGFRVVEEGIVPGSNVHSWVMGRDIKENSSPLTGEVRACPVPGYGVRVK